MEENPDEMKPMSQRRPSAKCERISHSVETFRVGLYIGKSISQVTVLHIYFGCWDNQLSR